MRNCNERKKLRCVTNANLFVCKVVNKFVEGEINSNLAF